MAEIISPQLLKVLMELTGEVKIDNALRIVAREAVNYRLQQIDERIRALEQKYGSPFEKFEDLFQAGKIPNQNGYEVEQEYLEWESLICR
jgi:translation initiation factor 2 alpha subunit (eIF-2alpha)